MGGSGASGRQARAFPEAQVARPVAGVGVGSFLAQGLSELSRNE